MSVLSFDVAATVKGFSLHHRAREDQRKRRRDHRRGASTNQDRAPMTHVRGLAASRGSAACSSQVVLSARALFTLVMSVLGMDV